MELELQIFHHSDKTYEAKKLGLDYNLRDSEIRSMTFYNINAIITYIDNGIEYCSIHTNNSEYICVENYEIIKDLIKNKLL